LDDVYRHCYCSCRHKDHADDRVIVKRTESRADHLRLVTHRGIAKTVPSDNAYFYDEAGFNEMLSRERKRSQRSMRPLMLMRLDISGVKETNGADVRRKLVRALASGIRDTDVRGWYKRGSTVGIVFTELTSTESDVREALVGRVMAMLAGHIDPDTLFSINADYQIDPGDGENSHACERFDLDCYRDAAKKAEKRDLSSRIRVIKDVMASLLMA
jgi:hypothetical protein